MSESRDGGDAVVDLDGDPVVVGVAFVALNMVSDLLYRLVDPRAR